MRRLSAHVLRSALMLLFILLLTADVRAQFKAGLQGTVTETAGAVVPRGDSNHHQPGDRTRADDDDEFGRFLPRLRIAARPLPGDGRA